MKQRCEECKRFVSSDGLCRSVAWRCQQRNDQLIMDRRRHDEALRQGGWRVETARRLRDLGPDGLAAVWVAVEQIQLAPDLAAFEAVLREVA